MNVYDTYFPRNFCGEYVDIKGNSSQLGMFMSVVLGIKPLMDDWIPTDRIAEFRKTCLRYKLKLREDVIFVNVLKDKLPANILGREFLTTTSAFAYPLSSGQEGQVHVFISKEEKFLRQGMWYPVIIKNRVIYHR